MVNSIHHRCFVYSFHHFPDQQARCSRLIWLNIIFPWFNWFRIFYSIAFILQDTLTFFSFSILSHSCYSFYFEVTLFFVETIVALNKVSQVVMFLRVQLFRILHHNTTIHAHMIGSYCYCRHYFTVCEFQVISFIVLSIQSTIAMNSEVRVVFLFWLNTIFLRFNSFHIFMYSHSYFKTNLHFFRFYHITAKYLI